MRTTVRLRLGIFMIPGLFWISQKMNGNYNLTAKPLAHRNFRLLKDIGFNGQSIFSRTHDHKRFIRWPSWSYGQNIADTILMPAETLMQNPPGDFGPVLCNYPNVIMTHCSSPNTAIADLLTAADMFDTTTYTFLTIITFIWLLIMGAASSIYSLWNIVTMTLSQNYPNYWGWSKRLLYCALLFMLLFVEFVFNSSFSTDMAIVQPPKLINTLEDLYLSSLKPTFFKVDNLYGHFMNSESARFSNVWTKVEQCGLDNCLLEGNAEVAAKLDFSPSNRDIAVVYSKAYLPAMVNYMCNVLGNNYKRMKIDGQRIFNSQPFSSVNFAYIINRNTESNVRQGIVQLSYFVIESGYGEKVWKDTEEFVEPVYGSCCPQTLFEEEKEITLPEPVSLGSFKRVLMTFLVALVFGIIILITELTFVRLQNGSNVVAIEPVSHQSAERNSKFEEDSVSSHKESLND